MAQFLIFCEILCKKDIIDRVHNILGFDGMLSVYAMGRSGIIAFLWRINDEVSLLGYYNNHVDHVDVVVTVIGD